jgi:maleate isomerase
MPDTLGWRMKLGVIAPSTNTVVQPEMDRMRPAGVTNHFARIMIPNSPIRSDADFEQLMRDVRATIMDAVDQVRTCEPGYLVMGMSAETFWDGLDGSLELERRNTERGGVKVAMGSDACRAALAAYGKAIKKLGIITPYMPVGDKQVIKFFSDCGFEVLALRGLECASPTAIAEVGERQLRDVVKEVDVPGVEAIVQVGTNLAFARIAALAEFWLDKPVIAINAATYWWALRQSGISDKVEGWGRLLAEM